MKKFKDFLKQEKDFMFGMFYLVLSDIFIVYSNRLFNFYNICPRDKILIFIFVFFELKFWSKGLELLFEKK